MESPISEELIEVAAIVAGAGATGTVQGILKSVIPQIAPELAGAVAGGLLWYFGDRVHPLVKAFGLGVLAGSLAPMIAGAIPKWGVTVGGTPAGTLARAGQEPALKAALARYGKA